MTTVQIDILRKDLSKFVGLLSITTDNWPEKEQVEKFFIDIYPRRMMGDVLTMNIPLDRYLVFEGYKLIK